MQNFRIQRESTQLISWDTETRRPVFHPAVPRQGSTIIIDETEAVHLALGPVANGMNHRIQIGDVPLREMINEHEGMRFGSDVIWQKHPYFESARGITEIILEARSEGLPSDRWKHIMTVEVFVLPAKLGETRYQSMTEDIAELSHNLLADLYGKSKRTWDLRFAREPAHSHSREQELASIQKVLQPVCELLKVIAMRPASCVRLMPRRRHFWGDENIGFTMITQLAQRAISPGTAARPITAIARCKEESFDVPEHRVAKAFLELVKRRIQQCTVAAFGHVKVIRSERPYRHVRTDRGPTLYELVDLPKIARLQNAIRKARESAAMVTALSDLPFLRDVRPKLMAVREDRSAEYGALMRIIRRFLVENVVWSKGKESMGVTKLTSRLFEQWSYLKVIEAFRANGVKMWEWTDTLRQNLRSRFLLDFDRGLMFEGELEPDLRLRFRYEPWIRCEKTAIQAGESLCRGSSSEVGWCPDIVIECLRMGAGHWLPTYVIVLDCKYTSRIGDRHWTATLKYQEIRSTVTRRQVVRQLWLIAPGEQCGIYSEDPALQFDDMGPSCAPDETVRFRLLAVPGNEARHISEQAAKDDAFSAFARGTLSFIRRELALVSAQESLRLRKE